MTHRYLDLSDWQTVLLTKVEYMWKKKQKQVWEENLQRLHFHHDESEVALGHQKGSIE